MKAKTIRLIIGCGLLIGITACGNTNQGRDDVDGTDSIFSDSTANDSPTWGDTTKTEDSLASPSFP